MIMSWPPLFTWLRYQFFSVNENLWCTRNQICKLHARFSQYTWAPLTDSLAKWTVNETFAHWMVDSKMSHGTISKSQFPFDTLFLTQHNSMPYALPGPTDTDSQHTCAVAAAEVRTRPHFHPPAPSSFIIWQELVHPQPALSSLVPSHICKVSTISTISLSIWVWMLFSESPTILPLLFTQLHSKTITSNLLLNLFFNEHMRSSNVDAGEVTLRSGDSCYWSWCCEPIIATVKAMNHAALGYKYQYTINNIL